MPVGVVVPVLGPAPWLAETLAAVLAQEPAAVVVVDDGSTPPLTVPYAERVRLVRHERTRGTAAARATALAHLDPAIDVVALCDADDTWLPGHLAAALAAGAAVTFGRAEIVGPDGLPTGERWPEPDAPTFAALFEDNPVPASSVVVRRDALEAAGGFDPEPATVTAEDWDLLLRLAAAGHPPVHAPGSRVRYRRHPGGSTADVLAFARKRLAVHAAHAHRVDPALRERVREADLRALAAGHLRARDFAAARRILAELPRSRADRLRHGLLHVPGVRALLGRRDPYRPRGGPRRRPRG